MASVFTFVVSESPGCLYTLIYKIPKLAGSQKNLSVWSLLWEKTSHFIQIDFKIGDRSSVYED